MGSEVKKKRIDQTGCAWLVAIIAIIASVFISVNNSKLAATSSLVMPALGIDTTSLSFLMSINGYAGFVLAFVAASIIMKVRYAQIYARGSALRACGRRYQRFRFDI